MYRRMIAFGGGNYTGGSVANPILLPDGTVTVPSLAFASQSGIGIYKSASSYIGIATGGGLVASIGGNNRIVLHNNSVLGFSGTTASGDTFISRSAAGALAVGWASVTTQDHSLSIYNTNNGFAQYGCNTELITLNTGGTTTDSSANLLPANSLILGVSARVTTTITTATNWALGDGTTAARFRAADTNLTAGTTGVGLAHWAGTVAIVQSAAAKLRITTTGTPGAGAIRVSVNYISFTPATS